MKQEYILLPKENEPLNDLIGKTLNQKTKDLAYDILCEIHSKAKKISRLKCLVYLTDLNRNEILGIGGSSLMKDKNGNIISDLINDNYGEIWSRYHRAFVNAVKSVTLVNQLGNNNVENLYRTGGNGMEDRFGGEFRIGSGTNPPARSDFNVQTGFGSAPESTELNEIGLGIYNGGTGRITGIATQFTPTGGSGTVREAVWFQELRSVATKFAMTRDLISPTVSFVAGQTITVDYTWQF